MLLCIYFQLDLAFGSYCTGEVTILDVILLAKAYNEGHMLLKS